MINRVITRSDHDPQAGLKVDESRIIHIDQLHTLPRRLEQQRQQGVRAFVAEGWSYGTAVLDFARHRSLSVPRDISLAVLDDNAPADAPPAMGFAIPKKDMGAQAVQLLTRLLTGPPGPRRIDLPCAFVAGTTVTEAPTE